MSRIWRAFYAIMHGYQRLRGAKYLGGALPSQLKRILIANWGSLGDVVLSYGVIEALRVYYPGCKIGFLVSRVGRAALQTAPPVDTVHEVDTWFDCRHKRWRRWGRLLKFILYDRRLLIAEIAAKRYDMAIELRPYVPNSLGVFWRAGIPCRVGFTTGTNAPLITHGVPWNDQRYLSITYFDLLEAIGVPGKMPRIIASERVDNSAPYLIFHLCSSNAAKEFPLLFWQELGAQCQSLGCPIYFTGKGAREEALVDQLGVDPTRNLVNQLDWNAWVAWIQQAGALISVDSVPVHLAALTGVPTCVLFRATPLPAVWCPPHPTTVPFHFHHDLKPSVVFNVVRSWIG